MGRFLEKLSLAIVLIAGVLAVVAYQKQRDTANELWKYEQQIAYGAYEKIALAQVLQKAFVGREIRHFMEDLPYRATVGTDSYDLNSRLFGGDVFGMLSVGNRMVERAEERRGIERGLTRDLERLRETYRKVMALPADRYVTADVREALDLPAPSESPIAGAPKDYVAAVVKDVMTVPETVKRKRAEERKPKQYRGPSGKLYSERDWKECLYWTRTTGAPNPC